MCLLMEASRLAQILLNNNLQCLESISRCRHSRYPAGYQHAPRLSILVPWPRCVDFASSYS